MVRGTATVPMDRAGVFEETLRLQPGKTALVVVDMQRAFLDRGEAMEVPAAREIGPQIRARLDLLRRKRRPVVLTEFTYSEPMRIRVDLVHPVHRRAAPRTPP